MTKILSYGNQTLVYKSGMAHYEYEEGFVITQS